MTPEHLPTEQYEAQLAEKVVRLQTYDGAVLPHPVPEVFSSPVSHYRMRAEFRIWHDGDDLYHIIFDQQTKEPHPRQSLPCRQRSSSTSLMTAHAGGRAQQPRAAPQAVPD